MSEDKSSVLDRVKGLGLGNIIAPVILPLTDEKKKELGIELKTAEEEEEVDATPISEDEEVSTEIEVEVETEVEVTATESEEEEEESEREKSEEEESSGESTDDSDDEPLKDTHETSEEEESVHEESSDNEDDDTESDDDDTEKEKTITLQKSQRIDLGLDWQKAKHKKTVVALDRAVITKSKKKKKKKKRGGAFIINIGSRRGVNQQTLDRRLVRRKTKNNEYINEEYFPLFCIITMIAILAGFVFEMQKAKWKFAPSAENSMFGPTIQVLIDSGAKETDKILDGEWWRLITSMYLHGGLIHLFLNLLVLWSVGFSLERTYGFYRVGCVYLLSGIAGNIASAIFIPETVTVGASGALFGLIGAMIGDFVQNHSLLEGNKCCYLFSLIFQSALGLAIGLMPYFDNFAHVGGFLVGLLSGTAFFAYSVRDKEGKVVAQWYSSCLVVICLVASVALVIGGFIALFAGMEASELDDFCGVCQKINCVETPWWNCTKSVRLDCATVNGTRACRPAGSIFF